jgi:glutaredoxin 3
VASVVVYTTPRCAYCVLAVRLLRKKGATVEEVDVRADRERRAWLAATTGRGTVPQVFVDGVPYGGYSELLALDRSGDLDAILGQGSR